MNVHVYTCLPQLVEELNNILIRSSYNRSILSSVDRVSSTYINLFGCSTHDIDVYICTYYVCVFTYNQSGFSMHDVHTYVHVFACSHRYRWCNGHIQVIHTYVHIINF